MPGADDLNWDDLRYFLRAKEAATLAGAARRLGVEHTTVGRRLAALERALGASLVLRGRDGLKLTPIGEKIIPLALTVERSMRAITQLAASEKSRVRLAMPSGFTRIFSAQLTEFRKEHPEISLELLSAARTADMEESGAQIAIRVGSTRSPQAISRKIGELGWSLYAAKDYLARRPAPVDLDDLSGHDIIGYDKAIASLPASQWLEARSSNATVVLRNREMVEMVAAAASGIGLAMLPCQLADFEPALERLTPKVLAKRELTIFYRKEPIITDELRAVIRFVIQVVRANAAILAGTARN